MRAADQGNMCRHGVWSQCTPIHSTAPVVIGTSWPVCHRGGARVGGAAIRWVEPVSPTPMPLQMLTRPGRRRGLDCRISMAPGPSAHARERARATPQCKHSD